MGLTGPFVHGKGADGILGLCRSSLAGGRGQAMILVSKMDGETQPRAGEEAPCPGLSVVEVTNTWLQVSIWAASTERRAAGGCPEVARQGL